MKIVKIGVIELDHGFWWDEYDNSDAVKATVKPNLDGGVVVFEQAARLSAIDITLQSRNDGWQTKATMEAIKALANGSIGTTAVVEDSDAVQHTVRFRHEVKGGAVQFRHIMDARDIGWYVGTVYLAKA